MLRIPRHCWRGTIWDSCLMDGFIISIRHGSERNYCQASSAASLPCKAHPCHSNKNRAYLQCLYKLSSDWVDSPAA